MRKLLNFFNGYAVIAGRYGLGRGGTAKTPQLWTTLLVGGLAAWVGCSTAQTAPSLPPESAANPPALAITKPSLLEILWKMATTEKAALPEQILPYLGINDVPKVKMVSESHGWFGITHQPPRFVNTQLQSLGLVNLFYGYNIDLSPKRERDYYSISPAHNAHCISAEEVIATFGETFKRLPPRVRTGAISMPKLQFATIKSIWPTTIEKGGLLFDTNLFAGRGSVNFEFDGEPCARGISINYTRKNQ